MNLLQVPGEPKRDGNPPPTHRVMLWFLNLRWPCVDGGVGGKVFIAAMKTLEVRTDTESEAIRYLSRLV